MTKRNVKTSIKAVPFALFLQSFFVLVSLQVDLKHLKMKNPTIITLLLLGAFLVDQVNCGSPHCPLPLSTQRLFQEISKFTKADFNDFLVCKDLQGGKLEMFCTCNNPEGNNHGPFNNFQITDRGTKADSAAIERFLKSRL